MRLLFPLLLAMVLVPCAVAQPSLIPDYTQATQYLVPQGWKVNASSENGVYSWQASENPDAVGAPGVVVLALNDFQGSSPELVKTILQEEVKNLEDAESPYQPSGDEAHFQLKGEVKGIPARIAALFVRDPANSRIFVGFFAAPADRYEGLGGSNLIYRMLHRPSPYAQQAVAAPNTGLPGTQFNMQDVQVQNRILQSTGVVAAGQLLGNWLQVFSYSSSDAYENVSSGEIRFGERGYGHLLEFRKDGSYQLTYQYKNFFQGCENTASIVETGTYRVNGNYLVLNRSRYTGNFNVCGQLTPQDERSLPSRTFRLGLAPDGNHLVIQGEPFEYSIGTETDANGKNYIQEGFSRIQNDE